MDENTDDGPTPSPAMGAFMSLLNHLANGGDMPQEIVKMAGGVEPIGELWFVLLWPDGGGDPEYLSGPHRSKDAAEYSARVTGVPRGSVKSLVSTLPS
jgi:hypothetical protein